MASTHKDQAIMAEEEESSHLWGQQEKCQVSSTKKDESPISCQAWDTVRTSGLDRFSLIMPPFLQIPSCKLGWYKIDELSYIKLKNFYSLKELWRSEKTNHQMGRDICNTYNQQRIRIQNIFKKLLKINSIKGGGKMHEYAFREKKIWISKSEEDWQYQRMWSTPPWRRISWFEHLRNYLASCSKPETINTLSLRNSILTCMS